MPADREIQLKFSADTNQVNAALDNTKRKAKETAREVNNVPKPRKSAKATSEPTGDDAKLQQNAAALRKEIEALSASYAALTAQTSKFADSLKKSLANLDSNTAAYEKNRAALEATIAKVDTLYNSLNNGTASLQRYTKALEKLSKEAKKVSLAKATAEVDKMSKALLTQQKNFTALEQRANQFAATWATKQAKANERVNAAVEKRVQVEKSASTQSEAAEKRAAAAQQKTQRQIQLTKLSYEELIQELIKYQTQLKSAASTEEFQAAQQQLKLIKGRLREVGREASLTGANAIASAKSFDKMALAFTRGAVTGRASIGAMVQKLGMFVKTHLALTAVTTIWTLFEDQISDFLDKWRELDPTSEKNKKRMQELAEAVREAGQAAIEAGHALAKEMHSDEMNRRAEIAISKIKREGEELENNIQALKKLSKARITDLEISARAASDETTLKKLQLENDYINGKISATEKAIALKKLEMEAEAAADNLKLDQAKEELRLRKELNAEAQQAASRAKKTALDVNARGGHLMSASQIDQYEKQRASIEEELKELAVKDELSTSEADRYHNQRRRDELNEIWRRLEEKRNASGRNTAEEYEAWQKELTAAQNHAAKLTERFNELNAQMYEQEETVNALSRENERRAATRRRINDIEEKNARAEEKQAQKDKANKERIAAARDQLDRLTYSEVQARIKQLRTKINSTSNFKRKERLREELGIYESAKTERNQKAREKGNIVREAGAGASGKAEKIVELSAKLAEKSMISGNVNFDNVINALNNALQTKSISDDAAAIEMFNIVQKLMTAAQKQSSDARILKRKYEILKTRLSRIEL